MAGTADKRAGKEQVAGNFAAVVGNTAAAELVAADIAAG